MWVIYEIEKHRDRVVGSIYGPYDDIAKAEADAEEMYRSESNYNVDYGTYYNDYLVAALIPPSATVPTSEDSNKL